MVYWRRYGRDGIRRGGEQYPRPNVSPGPPGLVDLPDASSPRYSAEYQQVRYLTVNVTSLETSHPFFLTPVPRSYRRSRRDRRVRRRGSRRITHARRPKQRGALISFVDLSLILSSRSSCVLSVDHAIVLRSPSLPNFSLPGSSNNLFSRVTDMRVIYP